MLSFTWGSPQWYRYNKLQGTVHIIIEATLMHVSNNKCLVCVYIYFNNAQNSNQNNFTWLKYSTEKIILCNSNKRWYFWPKYTICLSICFLAQLFLALLWTLWSFFLQPSLHQFFWQHTKIRSQIISVLKTYFPIYYLHITPWLIIDECIKWSIGGQPYLSQGSILGENLFKVPLSAVFIDV